MKTRLFQAQKTVIMKNIIIKIKQNYKLIIGVLIIGLLIGYSISSSTHQNNNISENKSTHQHIDTSDSHDHDKSENQIWTCSMHPQIKQNKPGTCPICAMDLIPLERGSVEGDHVDPNEIQMTKSAIALASVHTTIVKKGIPTKKIQLLGKVKADERNVAEITSRFGGRIEKLLINYTGQQVKKGEKLGTIYSPELISAQKELLESTKYQSTNPSIYKAAFTKLKLWNLTDQQIDEIVTNGEPKVYFEVLSPISGTVTIKNVAVGDYVKEGSALFEVIDLNRVWVMFDAYESDLPWISKGDLIEFTMQSLPGKSFSGKVSYIDPFINPQTRVAQVRIELENRNQQLKPEMFANGVLTSNEANKTKKLLIPKSAILWTGKRAVVYVKIPDRENTSFLYREIILGAETGDSYVVSEGLSEGEEIATNGVFKIDAAAQLAGKKSMMNPASDNNTMSNMQHDMDTEDHADGNIQHEMFKVSGNCGMCKETIETAAMSLNGVIEADWSQETHMIHINYNANMVKLVDIHKAIAKSGYDTELEKAPDDVYQNLPACCLYRE